MKWPPLQYNIFQNLLNFYKTIVNQSLEILAFNLPMW